jgi:V/A-type H+/Na+-transporting ATPase subunit E
MALADLLGAIEAEADAERARAHSEAAAAAATLVEQARRDATTLEADLADAGAADGHAVAGHERALARLEAAATIRSAREEAFLSLLTGIRAELATVRDTSAYPTLFEALVAESRTALPSACELRVDPCDADLAAALARGLRVEPALDTWGGVELASDDGRAIRNTLEERLANAEPLLRERLAQRLTPGTQSGHRSVR